MYNEVTTQSLLDIALFDELCIWIIQSSTLWISSNLFS